MSEEGFRKVLYEQDEKIKDIEYRISNLEHVAVRKGAWLEGKPEPKQESGIPEMVKAIMHDGINFHVTIPWHCNPGEWDEIIKKNTTIIREYIKKVLCENVGLTKAVEEVIDRS